MEAADIKRFHEGNQKHELEENELVDYGSTFEAYLRVEEVILEVLHVCF